MVLSGEVNRLDNGGSWVYRNAVTGANMGEFNKADLVEVTGDTTAAPAAPTLTSVDGIAVPPTGAGGTLTYQTLATLASSSPAAFNQRLQEAGIAYGSELYNNIVRATILSDGTDREAAKTWLTSRGWNLSGWPVDTSSGGSGGH